MKKFTQLVLLTLIMIVVTQSCQSPNGGGLYIHHIHQQTLANTADALRMVDDASKAGI